MQTFSLIVAVDQNMTIGYNGGQPIMIKKDLAHFKELTIGKTIVMGRRTQRALPKGYLPKRRNIVLSHQAELSLPEGVELAGSIDEVMQMTAGEEEVMIIGGGQIYRAFYKMATRIYLTYIYTHAEQADTFFPDVVRDSEWQKKSSSGRMTDEESGVEFEFICFERVSR